MSRPMRQNTPIPEGEQQDEPEPVVVEPVIRPRSPSVDTDDAGVPRAFSTFFMDYLYGDFANVPDRFAAAILARRRRSRSRSESETEPMDESPVPETREEMLRKEAKESLMRVFEATGTDPVEEPPAKRHKPSPAELVEKMLKSNPPPTTYNWS